jgi:glycosyltransferase involved in cell wall biosynthesis
VRRRLREKVLVGRVVVHGPVPAGRVAELYAAADVFVLASRTEPYGTVYGEAMAAGLPVVGWRAGNLPHLATDGQEAVIVPTGDVGALAMALTRLAHDETVRAVLGEAARSRAETFPTWDESAARFFAALRSVVR